MASQNASRAEDSAEDQLEDLLSIWENEHENTEWDPKPTLTRFLSPLF